MATISKRGDKVRAQLYVKGVRESKTFETMAEARAWAATREQQLRTNTTEEAVEDRVVDASFRRYMLNKEASKAVLFVLASQYIGPLQDAIDLGVATGEEVAALAEWKRYRVALMRLSPGSPLPEWPSPPMAKVA